MGELGVERLDTPLGADSLMAEGRLGHAAPPHILYQSGLRTPLMQKGVFGARPPAKKRVHG